MNSIARDQGLMPACDVTSLSELQNIILQTASLSFVVGFKLGIELVVPLGAKAVCNLARKFTSLPLIYDHQKYGNDIPDISSGKFLVEIKNAGFDYIIIFPFAGFNTLKATVDACNKISLIPIVGGEMTHPGFLWSEGGYLCDEAPQKIYQDAAMLGVTNFVVPGTKIESIKRYVNIVREYIPNPHFLFPGVGKGQGGDIKDAFFAAHPFTSTAIVGRGIYASDNMREAATKLWDYSRTGLEGAQ